MSIFYKELILSIWFWVNEQRQKLDSLSILIKKVTKAEVKAKIQTFISCKTNQHYYQGSCLILLLRPRRAPRCKQQRTPKQRNLRFLAKSQRFQQLCPTARTPSFLLKHGMKRKKIIAKIINSNTSKMAPLQPTKLIQLIRVRPIRKRLITEAEIVWAEQIKN